MSGVEILLGVATLFTAGSAYVQNQEAARVERRQAADAREEAEVARKDAASEASFVQEDAERLIGEAKAIAGASGLGLGGSAADVLGDLAAQKRYNTRAIIYGGDEQRRQLLSQASEHMRSARAISRNSALSVGATLLNGGYKVQQARKLRQDDAR